MVDVCAFFLWFEDMHLVECSHFIVPELGPETKFSYSSQKAVNEYREAKQLGIETVPVLVGPVTYLQLSKAEKSAPKDFDLLSLLDSILPIYK
jgi:5-methyltetrahydropteroyltriglutamate--homocysteine methyltransferase